MNDAFDPKAKSPKSTIGRPTRESVDTDLANLGAKLGYAERRVRQRRDKPGMIGFDDLGNAQYQWSDERMLDDSAEGETRRQRALSIANLVLVDDEPPPEQKVIQRNRNGVRLGYNPYDSGQLTKEKWKKPRDLRALSKWIESQRRAGGNPANDDE